MYTPAAVQTADGERTCEIVIAGRRTVGGVIQYQVTTFEKKVTRGPERFSSQ